MEIKILKEIDGMENACLVQKGKDFFVVSSLAAAFVTGVSETLVFPSNEEGKVQSWNEVAGGRGVSRKEAISELSEK